MQAYKSGRYPEAVQHFKQALTLDPENQNAELYLGTAYFIQWVPGADAAANARNYDLAQLHFKAVLAKDARNELDTRDVGGDGLQLRASGNSPRKRLRLFRKRRSGMNGGLK